MNYRMGGVRGARVNRGSGSLLDAAFGWFEPGRRNSQPVTLTLTLTFDTPRTRRAHGCPSPRRVPCNPPPVGPAHAAGPTGTHRTPTNPTTPSRPRADGPMSALQLARKSAARPALQVVPQLGQQLGHCRDHSCPAATAPAPQLPPGAAGELASELAGQLAPQLQTCRVPSSRAQTTALHRAPEVLIPEANCSLLCNQLMIHRDLTGRSAAWGQLGLQLRS
jgi:hypothetical protein